MAGGRSQCVQTSVFNISDDVGVVKWLAELLFLVSSTLLRNDRVGSPTTDVRCVQIFV